MSHSFVAYIDESGDDGFGNYREIGGRGGSSRWLGIAACLIRHSRELEAVSWRDEILERMPERQTRELHFAKLNHSQRIVACQILASKPVRVVSVLANKELLQADRFGEKNFLYFYVARYLVERLSWLCRDYRRDVPEGDGRLAITFSRRGGMSYDGFRNYLRTLQSAGGETVRIHWPVIDIEAVDAADHAKRAGLQLADTAASAFTAGVEPDRYGNCEPRYAEILKPVTYHHGGTYWGYGVKFMPPPDETSLSADQRKMLDLWR
jgi:hypothetical protein